MGRWDDNVKMYLKWIGCKDVCGLVIGSSSRLLWIP
jgi:hypothetical protein